MAAFSRSTRGLFGAPMRYGTPPISPDRGASPDAAPVTIDAAIPTYKKPSTLQSIAGVIGDTLSQLGGGQATFLQGLQQRQQMADQAAMAQRQRGENFADWERREKWKLDHAAPTNNDTVADYQFRVQTLGKDAADEWLRNGPDSIVTVTLPGNRVYSGPRSGLATALSGGNSPAPARPAIGAEMPDPRKAGGASPTGSRTFR